jgi:hypothetical protein
MYTLRRDVLQIGNGRYAEVVRACKEVLLRDPIFAHDNITKKIRIVVLWRCDYAKVCEDERGGGVGASRTVVHIQDLYGGFFGVTFSSPLPRPSHLLLGRKYTLQLFSLAPSTARLISRAFQLPRS